MRIRWGAVTDTGLVRNQNEDSYLAADRIFVVADGMGGHNAGEVASALAVKLFREALLSNDFDVSKISEIIEGINSTIYQSSVENSENRGMGTTLTSLIVNVALPSPNEQATVSIANVGDSRTYLLRDQQLKQISIDHSYVQELVVKGLISREEARTHSRRNIVTRAIGIDPTVTVDTWTIPMIIGDRYILCSDGLIDEVDDQAIAKCAKQHVDPQMAAKALVDLANENGGSDNTTVIVVDVVPDLGTSPAKSKTTLARRFVLMTIGAVLLTTILVLTTSFVRSGYFVAYESQAPDARVLIYQGKSFLWSKPTIEADSTLTRKDLNSVLARQIEERPTFASARKAQEFVNQIRTELETPDQ